MQVQSLGQESALEQKMATHSNILAWKIPWREALGGLQSWGCKELVTTERLTKVVETGEAAEHMRNIPFEFTFEMEVALPVSLASI